MSDTSIDIKNMIDELVSNANKALKQKATFITKDQEHSGVAYAIYNLILNNN